MTKVAGKCYVVPDPQNKLWKLVVHNTGQDVVGVTNNIFKTRQEALTTKRHDDNQNFGHGLLCDPNGSVSWQTFEEGQKYLGVPIIAGQHIRLGLRGVAFGVVELPPLNGEPVEIDFHEFTWYGSGRPQTSNMESHARNIKSMNSNVKNANQILNEILDRINNQETCYGDAVVRPIRDENEKLTHWEIEFENQGDIPWIGTAAFENAEDKNDGLGLESMAVPNDGSRAVQRIEAGGHYGVTAIPGAELRLGVRGFGYTMVALPEDEEFRLPVTSFIRKSSQGNDDFFDHEAVTNKRTEKLDKVRFFEGQTPLNDELVPSTFFGAEARARSTFDPPRLRLARVPHSPQFPGGGWVLKVNSQLPKEDEHGDLGCIVTLQLGEHGIDPIRLPSRRLLSNEQEKTWLIPNKLTLNGTTAQPGEVLSLDFKGLGWSAQLPLPEENGIDTAHGDNEARLFGFREERYNRNLLSADTVKICKR